MKQNIAFQALKPFIPPENCELYAESLTEDVAKACDSQEGESNPLGEGQEEGQEVMPMSFVAYHEIVIRQPTTPIYAYIFPIDCSEMYERTGFICIRDEIYDQKISLPCVRIPRWGIPDNAPIQRSLSKWGIQRILRSHVSKG